MAQQARNVCMHFQDQGQTPSYVVRDADTEYTRQSSGILESEGIKVKRHIPASPNLNAYMERFIQSIQQECLDHFIVCGERHFEYLIRSTSSTTTPSGRIRGWGMCRWDNQCRNRSVHLIQRSSAAHAWVVC